MDATFVITVFCILYDLSDEFLGEPKYKPKMVPAEIMLVAVVAARYFNNNLERALLIMAETGYIPAERRLSVSRFNRQLHQHADFLEFCLECLMDLSVQGEAFIIDSMPIPVCKRKRARRCKKVRGRAFCGYCKAKDEKVFGWRLHLICTSDGLPVAFQLLPSSFHDLTPIYELTVNLPDGSALFADKAYNDTLGAEPILAQDGLRLIPIRKQNMKSQHDWADEYDLRLYRKAIETVNSQLESMGINHLRARTNPGFDIKVFASLLALWHTQLFPN